MNKRTTKLGVLVVILILIVSAFAGCATNSSTESAAEIAAPTPTPDIEQAVVEPTELIVFAAASMTETLTAVGNLYMVENPDIVLIYNFDSSGTLKTQIEEGADCDIFISASPKQMDQLDIAADPSLNTDGLDFISEGTRRNILENKVTLCVPDGNPASVVSFDDLAAKLAENSVFLAMGNADVPVGQYTQKILTYYGLNEESLATAGCITYGSNVKEVVTQIQENTVDCGVVYCTDAFSGKLTIVDIASSEMCGKVIYPAAVLNTTASQDKAQAFLDYLSTPDAVAVFEAVGFSAIE